jgi:hypothetical protein
VEKGIVKPASGWNQWQRGRSQHPPRVNDQHPTHIVNRQVVHELKHCAPPRRGWPDEVLTNLHRFWPDKFNGWPDWADILSE